MKELLYEGLICQETIEIAGLKVPKLFILDINQSKIYLPIFSDKDIFGHNIKFYYRIFDFDGGGGEYTFAEKELEGHFFGDSEEDEKFVLEIHDFIPDLANNIDCYLELKIIFKDS